jgi:hypothetical protein
VQRRSFQELITVDPTTRRFTPLGLDTTHVLTEETCADYMQDLVSVYDLASDVPPDVQQVFERLRTVHTYGVLEYDLFTVANTQTYLAFEGVMRARFMDAYQSTVRFVSASARENIRVSTFNDVFELVGRGGKYSTRKGWSLQAIDGKTDHGNFNGSFPALLRWARAERLLSGQRSRMVENQAIKKLRDFAAHPERLHRISPIDSARAINDLAEFINRLWGHRTPGGHLYPAPVDREPIVIARTVDGRTLTSLTPDRLVPADVSHEWSDLPPFNDEDAWEFMLVLSPKSVDVLSYALRGLDRAPFPVDVLWGPDSLAGTAAAWSKNAAVWTGDCVETTDRIFIVPYPPGSDDPAWPLELATMVSRPSSDCWDRCLVVIADTPYDAHEHARGIREGGHEEEGICDGCRVTAHGLFSSMDVAIAVASGLVRTV